eukprot:SAG31_NODE_1447_length_8308_cov_58.914881_6_plen_185_part_00
MHDAGQARPLTYPGAAGEGNDSQAQQDNEVIKILRGKGDAQKQASAETKQVPSEAGSPQQAICIQAASEAATAAADQLTSLVAAGGIGEQQLAMAEPVRKRRWLNGPAATGGLEFHGEMVEGQWDVEVLRALDGAALDDWAEGRIGDPAQREMVARSKQLSEGRFARLPSSSLPPVVASLVPRL